jgi:hypothetical protein
MDRVTMVLWTAVLVALALTALTLLDRPIGGDLDAPPPSSGSAPAGGPAFGELPVTFVENGGQLPDEVAFSVIGTDRSLYFTDDGVTLVFEGRGDEAGSLRLDFLDVGDGVRPRGEDRAEGVVSYFRGAPAEWKTALRTYRRIVYPDVWPGIDLAFTGERGGLKYEFRVAPGAETDRIRLAWRGATRVFLDDAGALRVEADGISLPDAPPVAWQETTGERVDVPVAYRLDPPSEDGRSFGFEVDSRDPSTPLVLDPAIVVYCGFLGGLNEEDGYGVAVDDEGCAYVVGTTNSTGTSFPVKKGPDLNYNGGTSDAFIAKITADGTSLAYCGFLGGALLDYGEGVAIDAQGNALITGHTESDEGSFPVFGGPDPTFNGGTNDAFVAKLHSTGTMLLFCGYLGGSDLDYGTDVTVDSEGDAYVVGMTSSTDFPVMGGPGLLYGGGGSDGFVTKIDGPAGAILYSGYLGGWGVDFCCSIAVDATKHAFVTGATDSTNFPTAGPFDPSYNGGLTDAFAAKLNPSGNALLWSGYIGGGGIEYGNGIAIDGVGNAYVVGYTDSTETQCFPLVVGPDLTYNGGTFDGFVGKVNPQGTMLVYCGYVGGANADLGMDVAVDTLGRAWLTGGTESDESTFPVTVGPSLSHAGNEDVFVARVGSGGDALDFCGYLGGSGTERAFRIDIDAQGDAYVAGATTSTQGAGFPVAVGPDTSYNGGSKDAFLAKVPADFPPSLACRTGTVGLGAGPVPAPVLTINGSVGNGHHEVWVARGESITVSMAAPPGGPDPAGFALYAWLGSPTDGDVSPQIKDLGTMCFPTPLDVGSLPQPKKIWNNIGRPDLLGTPDYPSDPAPSTPLSVPAGIDFPVTVTFQGFIENDDSAARKRASITNAVILVVP